jgi:hypothetical protein
MYFAAISSVLTVLLLLKDAIQMIRSQHPISNFTTCPEAQTLQCASIAAPIANKQIVSGGAVFVLALSLSQVLQGGIFRIAASTPLGIPNLLGAVTVAGASYAAVHTSDAVACALSTHDLEQARDKLLHRITHPNSADIGISLFGMGLYKSLGGVFQGVAPSLVDNLGAYSRARASLPASLLYATGEERAVINTFGEVFGCHTCGRVKGHKYNADHMPPLKYVKKVNIIAAIL